MNRKLVTAGIVMSEKGILVTRRAATNTTPGGWEFPGGKLEIGETIEECLARELNEELSIRVDGLLIFDAVQHSYEKFTIVMIAYLCRHAEGTPIAHEHEKAIWLHPEAAEWETFDFLPADVPIVSKLVKYLAGGNDPYSLWNRRQITVS